MGAERVDYYSDDEYEQALAQESQQMQAQEQYPNVVPCYKCGGQMYQEGPMPENNICPGCLKAQNE